MKKLVMTVAMVAMILMAGSARADMTYAPFLFNGNDHAGNPIHDGTYEMVLDLNGDGWGGTSYLAQTSGADNASNWLWDSKDLVMDRGQIIDGQATPFKKISTADIPASYDANVDHYYLLWFDKSFNAGGAGPGGGVSYGAEDLGTVGTNPGDYTPFANGGSATLKTLGTQAVPEPVSTVLSLLGGGAMVLRRRFNKASI